MSEVFVVQSFTRTGRGAMRPDIPVQAQNANHAMRVATRLALQKVLVVAFMSKGDATTGEFEDPMLIVAHGDVPDDIREMPAYLPA